MRILEEQTLVEHDSSSICAKERDYQHLHRLAVPGADWSSESMLCLESSGGCEGMCGVHCECESSPGDQQR